MGLHILGMLLLKSGDTKITCGIIGSMTVVIVNAILLLNSDSVSPHPYSIGFAILSGLSLSLRNVLQKKHQSILSSDSTQSMTKVQCSVVQFSNMSKQSFKAVLIVAVVANVISVGFQYACSLPDVPMHEGRGHLASPVQPVLNGNPWI